VAEFSRGRFNALSIGFSQNTVFRVKPDGKPCKPGWGKLFASQPGDESPGWRKG
jgi:hypothetical protein